MKKWISLALTLALLLSLTACGGAPTADGAPSADGTSSADPAQAEQAAADGVSTVGMAADSGDLAIPANGAGTDPDADAAASADPNTIILGHADMLGGEFRYPGWGDSAAVGGGDWEVWLLTTGYAVMESDRNGAYQWSETAVQDHSLTENPDGTATLKVEIAHDLTYSDGTPITVKDYLARLLVFSSPVAVEAEAPGLAGQRLAGFDAFRAYTGDNDGADVDGVTASKVFSGVRMLDDYTYSLTISGEYYPDYFAEVRACLQPDPLALWLGDADIRDDGEGCYLTEEFYAKKGDAFSMARTLKKNRFDRTTYPFSGPYMVTDWDADARQAILKINPAYKGNFEGQRPLIETILYRNLVPERSLSYGDQQQQLLQQLQNGGVDVLPDRLGKHRIGFVMQLADDARFVIGQYQRAGYGKLDFACDLGPTMFTEVRQALAYFIDREAFCQSYLGDYGMTLDGPYAPDSTMWQAVGDDIRLNDYAYSPETAVQLLEDGGWVYNSQGGPYVPGGEGVDAVRYKKLTPAEADALDGINKTYTSIANTGGIVYQTVEINGEYYMPLVINWLAIQGSMITDTLTMQLASDPDLASAGMAVRIETGGSHLLYANIFRGAGPGARYYEGVPVYNMFNIVTELSDPLYDHSYCWSTDPAYAAYSANRLQDPYDLDFPYDVDGEKLTFDEAIEASGGKLGLDYLSMAMIKNAKTEAEYDQWWKAYVERWNQLLPAIPLYSNICYYAYNAKLEHFALTPFFGQARAILYANIREE